MRLIQLVEYSRTAYALKCDIRKFFECIDHNALVELLEKRIHDPDTRWLVRQIIDSFAVSKDSPCSKTGLPLGSVTSQLFSNIYLNEFDQWTKHTHIIECSANLRKKRN